MTDSILSEAAPGFGEILLRLLCAMALGTVIGTEREYSNRPAGMRTHILVALGACAVMITSQLIFFQYHAFGAAPDPARLPAQVITGVGFLGAGTILREGPNVKGLTTAASLWAVACLGVAAGGGYYTAALLGTIFLFITLTIFETLQIRLVGPESGLRCYWVETDDVSAGLDALNRNAAKQSAVICGIAVRRLSDDHFRIIFRIKIGGPRGKKRRELFMKGLLSDRAITEIRIFNRETYGPDRK